MTNGIGIWRCSGCGATYFPERLLCAHCRSAAFDRARVEEGVVEEITVIRHVLGQTEWQPKRVANVRTFGGPLMTVGLIDDAPGRPIRILRRPDANDLALTGQQSHQPYANTARVLRQLEAAAEARPRDTLAA